LLVSGAGMHTTITLDARRLFSTWTNCGHLAGNYCGSREDLAAQQARRSSQQEATGPQISVYSYLDRQQQFGQLHEPTPR